MTLTSALNIADLRALAQKRLPRMVFDYIDGGADDEIALSRNEARLRAHELAWNALVDVSKIDMRTTVMGQETRLPFLISPTAASRLFHPRGGELAVAKAAHDAGMIYSVSTIGSTSVEDIAKHAPGPKWFQVYVWKDRELLKQTFDRIRSAGFTGVILTVDVPVAGNRERDPRNGFSVPPRITPKTIGQVLQRPGYLWDILTTPRIGPANFTYLRHVPGGVMGFINSQFDRSVAWMDAAWMRKTWGGKFAVKGIITAADARRCVEIGADAVWVSNHGGRQLDASPATIDALPAIVEAVRGRAEVIFDGGVRRGSDIAKALALGATAVAIGRAYLWGLAAGGEAGVRRALKILETELATTLALMGCPRLADLSPALCLPPRSA